LTTMFKSYSRRPTRGVILENFTDILVLELEYNVTKITRNE